MGISLGIHMGHHASCALVIDGVLVSALQLERLSRQKHHVIGSLWNGLPIDQVLKAGGVSSLADVDVIVSSFQGIAEGGFGLHQMIVEPDFSLFDPFSNRHLVLSHHLAHAYCAAAYAPQDETLAVLISDYAGSATTDGADFDMLFSDWYERLVSPSGAKQYKSESLSIYCGGIDVGFDLKFRDYLVPHPGRKSFVSSVATLYENVTQAVFRKDNQHGSLMALAAYGSLSGSSSDIGPLLNVESESVEYRNDWQHKVANKMSVKDDGYGLSFDQSVELALLCQQATEDALLAYCKKASRLSSSRNLAVAGGTFLNILANSKIFSSGLFDTVSVPSAPHDAGIAVGCAVRGAKSLGDKVKRVIQDRLGPKYEPSAHINAIESRLELVEYQVANPLDVAILLNKGKVIARCAGRSEFGPRALGGRSLLASPLIASNKDLLNIIKGRQLWRPVAPIVSAEAQSSIFIGPNYSPWMTFTHFLSPENAEALPALAHPDNSTRAQTHFRYQDEWLDDLLKEVGRTTGYSVLLNTSLNGPQEPIIETHADALQWFLEHEKVDAILLDDKIILRRDKHEFASGKLFTPNPKAFVLLAPLKRTTGEGYDDRDLFIKLDGATTEIKSRKLKDLFLTGSILNFDDLDNSVKEEYLPEIWNLFVRGLILSVE